MALGQAAARAGRCEMKPKPMSRAELIEWIVDHRDMAFSESMIRGICEEHDDAWLRDKYTDISTASKFGCIPRSSRDRYYGPEGIYSHGGHKGR